MSALAAPLSSHLSELRALIFKVGLIFVLGTSLSFFFSESLLQMLTTPYRALVPDTEITHQHFYNETAHSKIIILSDEAIVKRLYNGLLTDGTVTLNPGGNLEITLNATPKSLMLFGPLDGFRITLWISFMGGLFLTFPLWFLLILQFILPALHSEEKKVLAPLSALSILFLIAAIFVSHKFTLPWMNKFLLDFNQSLGSNLWSVESYLDYVLGIYIAHIALFELILILFILVYKGWITSHHLSSSRRGAYLTAFILGAFLTPPDVLSQLCVALPLIIFYELAAAWAFLTNDESGRK